METRLTHRDGPGGLFIGASVFSFALMNLAPAELLHLLVDAALQPYLAHSVGSIAALPTSAAKKNAGNKAGAGIVFQERGTIFRRKGRHARHGRT
jgi:hypothetical protein